VYPVKPTRSLESECPQNLLPKSLRPAVDLCRLSPADRVFGWVNGEGQGAHRGQLRIGPIACHTEYPLETFGTPGVPLAILGQPKPQQARFYVAASQNGSAQADNIPRTNAGYLSFKGLRGRKVYPHHYGLPTGYWLDPMQDRTQQPVDGHFQEYRRPRLNGQEQRDDQNRSVSQWVKPGVTFEFDIDVINLSPVELGALLWLLDGMGEGRYHRLGGGKPLGFGSVCLDIDWEDSSLCSGEALKNRYLSLTSLQKPDSISATDCIDRYKQAVACAYKNEFDQVPFIAAFLRAASGFNTGLPTHYPQTRAFSDQGSVPPLPAGESFKWFVENERTGKQGGPKLALPDLVDDQGLPVLAIKQGR